MEWVGRQNEINEKGSKRKARDGKGGLRGKEKKSEKSELARKRKARALAVHGEMEIVSIFVAAKWRGHHDTPRTKAHHKERKKNEKTNFFNYRIFSHVSSPL